MHGEQSETKRIYKSETNKLKQIEKSKFSVNPLFLYNDVFVFGLLHVCKSFRPVL